LSSQDEDGYIGIYKPNLRYQHEGSNGELWAQTTAFRALLAYYEFTQENAVLEAVEKAVKHTMKNYNEGIKNPFDLKNAFGGVTHGLMFTDVCETLYRITKNQDYQDYATYLYKAFSSFSINRSFNDLRYPFLLQKDSMFEGHAVHTYEHIRTMTHAYFHTGYPELESAYKVMLNKLNPCILPSGAGHGNEWIAKLEAHPEHTASEYCTMVELRNSYGSLIQKTGDIAFADAAEKLTYNAMLGFRNEKGTAITYGKADNCYHLDGHHHHADGEKTADPRYKYSPTHSEPAVCCVPNYGRNLSYFLEQSWMKSEEAIALVMYGPNALKTTIGGSTIEIEQETNYPLSDKVTLNITLENPQTFTLLFRKPAWTKSITFSEEVLLENGYYAITREFASSDQITLEFDNPLNINEFKNGEYYMQKGAVVYALEIPHHEEKIKTYKLDEYSDYYCLPADSSFKQLNLNPKENDFVLVSELKTDKNPWYTGTHCLKGYLYNSTTKSQEEVKMVPMGRTVLRKVTFNPTIN